MGLPDERAAVIAEMTAWDAKWAAENPVGLQTPGSHMVCRALVQTVLKKENELEPRMRLGGHNMGLALVLLDDAMKAMIKAIVDYAGKCDHKPDC